MLAGHHYIWMNRFHVNGHLRYVMFAAQMNIWADDPITGRDDFESALNLLPTLLLRYLNFNVNKLLHQHNTYQYISIYLIITSVSYMYIDNNLPHIYMKTTYQHISIMNFKIKIEIFLISDGEKVENITEILLHQSPHEQFHALL